MAPTEYYNWAKAENLTALRRNREAAYPPSDHVRYGYVTERSGWSTTRYGGGVGWGGFGGSGGYAGYLGAADSGYSGFGFGYGRPGNSIQNRWGSSSISYTMEYHDWPTFNGGDVELLNPYVRPRINPLSSQ